MVAVNDIGNLKTMAHLLKYDSNYGRFDGTVEVGENALIVDGKSIKFFKESDPAMLPWGDLRILASNESMTVAGSNARDILNSLIERGLVSRLDHAGYLGRELEKAEIALRLKRNYVQDEPLWPAEKS